MTAGAFLNVCRFTAASSGTGDFVVSSAVTGYQTPASAGAANGTVYSYRAESADLTEWEIGEGAYTSGSTTLARTTVTASSNAGAKVNFTASPQVAITALAADLLAKGNNLSDVPNSSTSRLNLGVAPSPPQGRLSNSSSNPNPQTTVSGATTIYYHAFVGRHVPIYDGTRWKMHDFGSASLSQATTDSTKSPAAATTNSNYDIFVWNDAGTYRATRGPAWSSDTTRGTGAGTTELSYVEGILTNANSITNGPSANRGTYVGTVRTNGSSQVDFIFGASGTAAFFGCWNAYNRIQIATTLNEGTSSWTYGSTTVRALNNTSIARVSMIRGLDEDGVYIQAQTFTDTNSGVAASFGFGLDSTSTNTVVMQATGPSVAGIGAVQYAGYPGLGFHYLQQTEKSSSASSYTAYGSSSLSTVCATLWG